MSKKYTLKEIKIKAAEIHNNKYNYVLVEYENMHKKEKIICEKHGVFEQSMSEHINKHKGCKMCAIEKRKDNLQSFVIKAKKTHGDKYNYDESVYIDSKTHITIKCLIHGDFIQKPKDHINNKQGCPTCNESKGEKQIRLYLDNNNIEYVQEKRFNECKDKYTLPFDFYLTDYKTCIEFDGEQHFKAFDYFGGNNKLKIIQKHDKIKTKYCKDNKIQLYRINYDDNIDSILNEIIKNFKV